MPTQVEVRLVREHADEGAKVATPRDVFRFCVDQLGADEWPQERFYVFTLSTQNEIIEAEMITSGILDASVVHPREVFRLAILRNAAAIIVAHNHPSGDPTPSPADREVTRQLVEAGKILGIPVRDHVIVGLSRYASFLDLGLI